MDDMENQLKIRPLQYVFLLSEFNHSNQIETILQCCVAEGIEIQVIYIGEKSSFYAFLEEKRIPSTFIAVETKRLLQLFILLRSFARVSGTTKLFVSGQRASSLALIVTYFFRIQFVVWRHHADIHLVRNLFVPRLLDKLLCFISRKILAVSAHHKQYLVSSEKLPDKKIEIMPGGFNLDEFLEYRQSSRKRNFHSSQKRVEIKFGVCSRLVFEKGVQHIIAAFSEFLSLGHMGCLLIRGDGPYKEKLLRNLPAEIRNKIQFIDRVPTPLDFYSSIDVFIHVPIHENTESLGMVYLEGMAAGIPCIFTKSGVLNDLPNVEEYIRIVPFSDPKSILDNMITFSERLKFTSQFNPYPEEFLDQFSLNQLPSRFRSINELFN